MLVSFATAFIVYQNCFILSSTFLFYFLSFVLCRSVRVHLSATKAIISLCPLSVNRKLYLFSYIFIFPQKPHKSCSDKSCTLCFYFELYELCIIFILNFSLHVNIYLGVYILMCHTGNILCLFYKVFIFIKNRRNKDISKCFSFFCGCHNLTASIRIFYLL